MTKKYTLFDAAKIVGVPRAALVTAAIQNQVPTTLVNGPRNLPIYMISKDEALKFRDLYNGKSHTRDTENREREEARHSVRKSTNTEAVLAAAAKTRVEMLRDLRELGLTAEEAGLELPEYKTDGGKEGAAGPPERGSGDQRHFKSPGSSAWPEASDRWGGSERLVYGGPHLDGDEIDFKAALGECQ